MTRPAPGIGGDEQLDPGRDQLALAGADRVGEPDQLRRGGACRARARRRATRAPARAARDARSPRHVGAGDAQPGDVQLVDRVERSRRVAGQHVGETGREAAAGDDPRAARRRQSASRASSARSVGVAIGADAYGIPAATAAPRQRGVDVAGQRRRDRVDLARERGRRARARRARRRRAARSATSRACSSRARRDDHAVDARGVDELAGGPDADLAQPGDEDGSPRLTGSRDPAARASRRSSAGPGPCPGRAPPRHDDHGDRGHEEAALEGLHAGGESTDGAPTRPRAGRRNARRASARSTTGSSQPPARRKYSATISPCCCVGRAQPAADRLGREAPVRERAHERPARAHARGRRRRTPRPGARGSRPTRSTRPRRTTSSANGRPGSAFRSCTTVSAACGFAASSAAFMPSTVR